MATSTAQSLTVPSTRTFSYLASRTRYWTWSSLRFLQASSSSSSSLAARLTYALEASSPQSSFVIAETFRVETPWTYISARASLRAVSLRSPCSKVEG